MVGFLFSFAGLSLVAVGLALYLVYASTRPQDIALRRKLLVLVFWLALALLLLNGIRLLWGSEGNPRGVVKGPKTYRGSGTLIAKNLYEGKPLVFMDKELAEQRFIEQHLTRQKQMEAGREARLERLLAAMMDEKEMAEMEEDLWGMLNAFSERGETVLQLRSQWETKRDFEGSPVHKKIQRLEAQQRETLKDIQEALPRLLTARRLYHLHQKFSPEEDLTLYELLLGEDETEEHQVFAEEDTRLINEVTRLTLKYKVSGKGEAEDEEADYGNEHDLLADAYLIDDIKYLAQVKKKKMVELIEDYKAEKEQKYEEEVDEYEMEIQRRKRERQADRQREDTEMLELHKDEMERLRQHKQLEEQKEAKKTTIQEHENYYDDDDAQEEREAAFDRMRTSHQEVEHGLEDDDYQYEEGEAEEDKEEGLQQGDTNEQLHNTLSRDLPDPAIAYKSQLVEKVTVIVSTHSRFTLVHRLLSSVRRFVQGVSFMVVDYGDLQRSRFEEEAYRSLRSDLHTTIIPVQHDLGGTASHNRLLSLVVTPYFLVCNDDYVFTEATTIELMLAVLETSETVDIVAGSVETEDESHHHEQWQNNGGVFVIRPVTAELLIAHENLGAVLGSKQQWKEGRCNKVDTAGEFIMGRVKNVMRVNWDERMHQGEAAQQDFFLRTKAILGRGVVALCPEVRVTAKEDNMGLPPNLGMWHYFLRKHNLVRVRGTEGEIIAELPRKEDPNRSVAIDLSWR
ncbi:Beta-1,4 N-acetylgalactosaminyltransferase 2 [Balamuthia mandrillaris]